ncbi:MAG: TlpA family protein disulfide reductase [Flavobacterium sp.]|nr:TlpA family protein disulfide reductase [Flavobacterium sp.]
MIRVIIAFTLFLIFSFFSVLTAQTSRPKPIQIYQKDGVLVNAYDFKNFEPLLKIENDTTYVINFWATWCQPCVAELPNFERVNTAYKEKKLKVILVSLDMKKQVETALLPFIKRKKIASEVIFMSDPDANSWISKVDVNWSGAIPATVIYNSQKRQFYERSFTFDELNNEIKQFIN